MNRFLITFITVIVLLSTILSAGCLESTNTPIRDSILMFDAVCGVRITFTVNVVITLSDQYDEGTTHYRIFDVDVSVPSSVSLSPTTVCSREPVLNGRTVGPYELYSAEVGQWNGLDWNNNGMIEVTTLSNGTEGEDVYDIPKPGRYGVLFGYTFGIEDLKDAIGLQQIVPTYLRFSLGEKFEDVVGTIEEYKIPFLATLPRYTDGRSTISYSYQVEFYAPIGGRLLEQVPDELEFTFYETHQSFKLGYDKPAWADITVPAWTLYSLSTALFVIGSAVNPLVQVTGAVMFAATASMFGVDWSADFTLFKWDDNLVPYFVALDTKPISSTATTTAIISVT